MQSRLQTVLFDLDGTLIDSTALILDTYRATAREHGRPVPDDGALMRAFGTPLRDNLAQWSEDPAEVDAMMATYSRLNDRDHDARVKAFDGVEPALEALKARGVRLGVVTGKRLDFARRGLEVSGLARLFEVVVGPESTSRHKPHPEPVQEGLRLLGQPIEGAAYVGDSPSDVGAGRAAGVEAIAVAWGPVPRAVVEAAGPHRWLKAPGEIASL